MRTTVLLIQNFFLAHLNNFLWAIDSRVLELALDVLSSILATFIILIVKRKLFKDEDNN